MTKNIYFRILKIKFLNDNYYELKIKNIQDYNLEFINKKNSLVLGPNQISELTIHFEDLLLNVKSNSINETFPIKLEHSIETGFDGNTFIETKKGPIMIKELNAGDKIISYSGDEVEISNLYLFKINNKLSNKLITINKSKCGINLPYNSIVMTLKNNLKIKKITLKGRSLYLNGKAEIYDNNDIYLYAIETEYKKDYLVSGFITESI